VFCNVNVTSDESVDAGFAKARARHGQERILVNCAGTGNAVKTASRSKEDGSIKHFPLDAFDRIIQINLVGTFRCIAKSAAGMLTLEPMEDGERGAMVNTASVAAEDGQMGQAAYSASKGGIVGMTLPIARDLMSEGIRVNTILPGIFNTPLMNGAPQAVKDALAASVPFPKRLGHPHEFAHVAMTMIECGYFNGEDVRVDGAIRMAPR
jgi:NAD(P)-dependent dehydrogenase (short-subunit alcohol dehydrogenase family)